MAKLTAQQQRDRRSKIMLAVLGCVFLAVLAFQLPKLMHSGGGGQAAAPPATTAGTALASAPAAVTPSITPSQLQRFNRFAPKDPFKAGVKATTTGAASGSTPTATDTTQAPPKPSAQPSAKDSLTLTMSQTPVVPPGPRVPAALVMFNGKRHVILLDTPFPTKHPLFRLAAVGAHTVWLQLIGGSLGNGSQTLKLDKGAKLTLVDTTADVRFVLSLLRPTTAPKPIVDSTQPGAPAKTTTG